MNINPNYKDRLFCFIFGKEKYKGNLLSLYNALNGTHYDNVDDVEINTLEDAVYMKMRNDVSCIVSSVLSLYEQQSTFNPNMPFREFEYCAKLYNKIMEGKTESLYGSALIKIPAPQCYVFYNGTQNKGDKVVLKLSDAFEVPVEGYEWTTTMLNINSGHNKELLESCKALAEYSELISRIRLYQKSMTMVEAVDKAILEQVKSKGVLSGLLRTHRSEVVDMCITEFDEEKYERTIRNEGRAEGRAEGRVEGEYNATVLHIQNIKNSQNISFDKACEILGVKDKEKYRNYIEQ